MISHPFDTLVVAVCALAVYYWGAATVPSRLVRLEGDEAESETEPVAIRRPADVVAGSAS